MRIISLACASVAADLASATQPVVQTAHGPVQGFDREAQGQTISTFWGIPFATPPLGDLRFHYPKPLNHTWTEPLNASVPPIMCSQDGHGSSEDCLNVNVYTPRKVLVSNAKLLPVMFWIYGGAFKGGDNYNKGIYDAVNLVGRHDVVVVAGNYRLSAMGFSTYVPGPHGERGSAGMADQRLALEWSFNNVKAFGGNNSRTTIFGESAGGMSVLYHLVSPPSWPFFSAAIVESGPGTLGWLWQPLAEAETLYTGWASGAGCPSGSQQLQCLQALPQSELIKPPSNFTGRSPILGGGFWSGPVVDGTDHGLLGVPMDLIKAGKFAQVPLIIGANKDDGSVFEPAIQKGIPGAPLEAHTQKDVDLVLNWLFDPIDAKRVNETYPVSEFQVKSGNPYRKALQQAYRDLSFHCANADIASAWAQHGLDAFVYSFAFDLGPVLNLPLFGDIHAAEIPFVFRDALLNDLKLLPLDGNVEGMSNIMQCLWASFAHSGTPNGDAEVVPNCKSVHEKVDVWPSFKSSRAFYHLNDGLFDSPKAVKFQADNKYPHDEYPSDKRCDVIRTVKFLWRDRDAGDNEVKPLLV